MATKVPSAVFKEKCDVIVILKKLMFLRNPNELRTKTIKI